MRRKALVNKGFWTRRVGETTKFCGRYHETSVGETTNFGGRYHESQVQATPASQGVGDTTN